MGFSAGIEFSPIEGALNQIREKSVPSITVVPALYKYLASYYHHGQGLHLGKTIDDFSLQAARVATSDTMKASQWWGNFYLSYSLIFLTPKLCFIFSKTVSSTSFSVVTKRNGKSLEDPWLIIH